MTVLRPDNIVKKEEKQNSSCLRIENFLKCSAGKHQPEAALEAAQS